MRGPSTWASVARAVCRGAGHAGVSVIPKRMKRETGLGTHPCVFMEGEVTGEERETARELLLHCARNEKVGDGWSSGSNYVKCHLARL